MRCGTVQRHGWRRLAEVEGREVGTGICVWREGDGVEEVLGSDVEVAVVGKAIGRVAAGD